MAAKQIYHEVEIDAALEDFSDQEIREEYESRFCCEKDVLEKIWLAMRLDDTDTAYTLMYDYVCDKLGKVL